jgi:hypothetical protein
MTMIDIIRKLVKQPEAAPPAMLAQMDGIAERNAARIAKIKEEMGTKWILHPSHTKTRLDEPRPV